MRQYFNKMSLLSSLHQCTLIHIRINGWWSTLISIVSVLFCMQVLWAQLWMVVWNPLFLRHCIRRMWYGLVFGRNVLLRLQLDYNCSNKPYLQNCTKLISHQSHLAYYICLCIIRLHNTEDPECLFSIRANRSLRSLLLLKIDSC